jgi:hypothetical protein
MALGPAVAAAGASVATLGSMGPEQASGTVGVAESVMEAAVGALDAIDDHVDGADPTIHFAHRVAHATHLASALAGAGGRDSGAPGRGHQQRPPALWPRLLESLSVRIRVIQPETDGMGADTWPQRVHAASACRDAASHSMRAHALVVAVRTASSTERLIRCLTFASLYCGFAALDGSSRCAELAGLRLQRDAGDAPGHGHRGGIVRGGLGERERVAAEP